MLLLRGRRPTLQHAKRSLGEKLVLCSEGVGAAILCTDATSLTNCFSLCLRSQCHGQTSNLSEL